MDANVACPDATQLCFVLRFRITPSAISSTVCFTAAKAAAARILQRSVRGRAPPDDGVLAFAVAYTLDGTLQSCRPFATDRFLSVGIKQQMPSTWLIAVRGPSETTLSAFPLAFPVAFFFKQNKCVIAEKVLVFFFFAQLCIFLVNFGRNLHIFAFSCITLHNFAVNFAKHHQNPQNDPKNDLNNKAKQNKKTHKDAAKVLNNMGGKKTKTKKEKHKRCDCTKYVTEKGEKE